MVVGAADAGGAAEAGGAAATPPSPTTLRIKVATANILSATPADQRGAGGGANVTGRMHELDAIFAKEAYDIVGIQEGRLSSQRLDTEHY